MRGKLQKLLVEFVPPKLILQVIIAKQTAVSFSGIVYLTSSMLSSFHM